MNARRTHRAIRWWKENKKRKTKTVFKQEFNKKKDDNKTTFSHAVKLIVMKPSPQLTAAENLPHSVKCISRN